MISTQQEPQRKVTKHQLELYLKNGEEFVELVLKKIEQDKLPYEVKRTAEGIPILVDTLSPGELHLAKFVTQDKEMLQMKSKAIKAAATNHELLIVGPTGTGKEIIARSQIHTRKGSFRAINCAGIPETLIESILFGHVKGSFTGATSDRRGFIEEATDGVMFMDEIGEMPLLMQAKLLRAIQEKRINKVGSTIDTEVNCKFVFATNKNLYKMVEQGLFREDLLARISMLELNITPLSERLGDAVPIAQAQLSSDKFLEKYASALAEGHLNLNHNVRSIQRYIARYNVWGSID